MMRTMAATPRATVVLNPREPESVLAPADGNPFRPAEAAARTERRWSA